MSPAHGSRLATARGSRLHAAHGSRLTARGCGVLTAALLSRLHGSRLHGSCCTPRTARCTAHAARCTPKLRGSRRPPHASADPCSRTAHATPPPPPSRRLARHCAGLTMHASRACLRAPSRSRLRSTHQVCLTSRACVSTRRVSSRSARSAAPAPRLAPCALYTYNICT